MHRLRLSRILISTITLSAFALVFALGTAVPVGWAATLAGTQFVPSLLQLLLGGAGALAVAAIIIVIATLLFGRLYCAAFCPLGVLQDLVSWGSRKVRRKRRPWRRLPSWPWARYGLLALVVLSAAFGSLALLNLLDPYSLFGRLATDVLRPLVVAVNNGLVAILERSDIYALVRRRQLAVPAGVLAIVGISGLVLVLMAARWGRLWCNVLCPVGALLGLLSERSWWRIRLRDEACSGCGICAKSCRAGCIDSERRHVDSSRCVACFDCLDACPSQALTYARAPGSTGSAMEQRRRFLGLTALVAAAVPLRLLGRGVTMREEVVPICPPGAGGAERFARLCTGCQLCVATCPERVLQPALLEYGPRALMQPVLNYEVGYCTYECKLCGEVCPTGAIEPLALEVKQRLQIGQAELDKDACVVYKHHQECGACIEVCPTHAVYSEEREGILYPELDKGPCIGCGHCQIVCPETQPPAIRVEARASHREAEPPNYDRVAPELLLAPDEQSGQDGFPF